MIDIYNLFRSELYKFKNNSSCINIILFSFFIAGASSVVRCHYNDSNAYEQMRIMLSNTTWLQLVYIFITISFISNDFYEKTINFTIVSGYKRGEILLVKFLLLSIIIFITDAIYFLISMLITSKLNGLGEGTNVFSMYINSFIILYGSFAMYFVFSSCIKDSLTALIISVVMLLTSNLAISILYKFNILPTSIYNYSAMNLLQSLLTDPTKFKWYISFAKTTFVIFISFSISSLSFSNREF